MGGTDTPKADPYAISGVLHAHLHKQGAFTGAGTTTGVTAEVLGKGIRSLLEARGGARTGSDITHENIKHVVDWLIASGAIRSSDHSAWTATSHATYTFVTFMSQRYHDDCRTFAVAEGSTASDHEKLIEASVQQAMAWLQTGGADSLSAAQHHAALDASSAADVELLDTLWPKDWQDAEATAKTRRNKPVKYNLLAIGGGVGGLVSTIGSSGVGARCALVEKTLLGGDCLNVGCVPSKALLAAAHKAHLFRQAAKSRDEMGDDAPFDGISIKGEVDVDFPAVMENVRKVRAAIGHHDGVERLKTAGVDVYLGSGRFTGPKAFEINGQTIHFAKAVICTGSHAFLPPIPGLAQADPLTNGNVFNMNQLPKRLVVIGAGVIGCELAQAFSMLGSQVTLFSRSGRILPKEDADAAKVVQDAIEAAGVTCHLKVRYVGVKGTHGRMKRRRQMGRKVVRTRVDGRTLMKHVICGVAPSRWLRWAGRSRDDDQHGAV